MTIRDDCIECNTDVGSLLELSYCGLILSHNNCIFLQEVSVRIAYVSLNTELWLSAQQAVAINVGWKMGSVSHKWGIRYVGSIVGDESWARGEYNFHLFLSSAGSLKFSGSEVCPWSKWMLL